MKGFTHGPLHGERGMALVSIMMIIGALAVLSIGFIMFSSTEVQIADNYKNHAGALYVAEAGISEVLARMNLDPGTQVNVNGQAFDAYIGDNPTNPDPNWRTEIHVDTPANLPAPSGTEIVTATIQPSANWLDYGGPDLAPIVVEHKWKDRNGDGIRDANEIVLYDEARHPAENFESGNPVDIVTASGMYNGSLRTIRAEVTRAPISANVTAPIVANFDFEFASGESLMVCGHNHDINMPVGTTYPGCMAWELCDGRTKDAEAGCLFSVTSTGDEVKVKKNHVSEGPPPPGEKKFTLTHGFPSWADTSSYNVFYSVWDALGISQAEWDTLKADADTVEEKMKDTTFNGFWVAKEDGKDAYESKASMDKLTGSGLLWADGSVKTKQSTWTGLIYAEGEMDIGSSTWILGGVMTGGREKADDPTKFKKSKQKKKSQVFYSQQAIAQALGSQRNFKVLSWREL